MRLAVLGTGYVGLVAGAGFADFGNDVVCVDIDAAKIAQLERGELPIYEPGLESLVRRSASEGRLRFTTDLASAVSQARVVFLAVGTPSAHDGSADISQVLNAAISVGRALNPHELTVVVTKSTVPVGTADRLAATLSEHARGPFSVASNPEFLKEGDAVNDFMKPDRIIIGSDDARAREILHGLYAPFVRTNDRVLFMDARSAELTKYAANAFLATRISFMNEMARLCEKVGADVELVRRGMGMDPRIGAKFLFPGIGYGGSCFPKDVRAALHTAAAQGGKLEVLDAVHRVNEGQKRVLAEKVLAHFGGNLHGRSVAVWGLAFKPGTDDVREAPALVLIEALLHAGAQVRAHDPVAAQAAARLLGERPGLTLHANNYDAADGADALCLCTEWHQFRRPDFARLKSLMRGAALFDGRNVWDAAEVAAAGFSWTGIGRPSLAAGDGAQAPATAKT